MRVALKICFSCRWGFRLQRIYAARTSRSIATCRSQVAGRDAPSPSPTTLERVRVAFPTRAQIAHIPAQASQHRPKSSPWTARRRSCRLPMKAKALDNGSPGRTGALIERRSRNFVRKGAQTARQCLAHAPGGATNNQRWKHFALQWTKMGHKSG